MKTQAYWAGILGVAMLSISLPVVAKDPLPSSVIPGTAGVAAHFNSYEYNPAYTDRTFDAVADANFRLVRFVPDWQHIEKRKGYYDFTIPDWLTNAFTSRKIRPVLCLGLNNPLYGVNSRIRTPEQREAFGRFVEAMVQHYRGKGVIWEIWNEPNIPAFWRPLAKEQLSLADQITEYLAMLEYVVPIIRKNDPEALIIGPGAANYNTAWMREALRRGLLQHLDGLSAHPYQGKERPELVITQHQQVQSWIPASDKGKPVFFTEWGYSTGMGPNEVPEHIQAAYAQRQYMLSLMLGIKGNFMYSLANASGAVQCLTPNSCYGLFNKATGASKSAYAALKSLTDQLNGYQFTRRITYSDPTIYMMELKKSDGSTRYALWCSTNSKQVQVTLPNKKVVTANYTVQIFE